ncbi:MAG TPA: HD domain-containing protein [Candidatus Limnocylindrales bacterium]|nr:HD domain-containing protein [Candidatus Limnocylindrales bacterium]
MTVPARREAARLLLSLDPPAWSLRHACAVADVAGFLARSIQRRGTPIDVRAVEAAALLHDVDKIPAGLVPGVRHGDGSAAWLEANGMPELAPIVRDHPVTRLADDADAARLEAAPLEAKVVAYADKRAGQALESMDERFGSWRRRYPSGPADPVLGRNDRPPSGPGWADETAARVEARAQALEAAVCAAAGVQPTGVRRLRWSRRALREAVR